ncbi:hypothetical protein O3G_MSEX013296 [Manduca sexta]|uniref:BTB domain-containing protein n=1 Tax=Manduca sexta TaxID=7130 RepID=A0A921ZSA7_MANSE|nr:hypothetical protein O3G_MSEX013296 [Manduca sexta]
MESKESASSSERVISFTDSPDVVFGHKRCNTSDVKWVAIKELYEKIQRPHYYDIGGTYNDESPDYWFTCKTEQVLDIYLLHLFVYKYGEGAYNVAVSVGNYLKTDKKNNTIHLPRLLKEYDFNNTRSLLDLYKDEDEHNINRFEYITTYKFTDLDIEFMKDKIFLIAVSFGPHKAVDLDIVNEIKLSHDYGELFKDPVGSDFTIESSDGEKFEVHKIILSAHSTVFKAMFKEETAESQNSYVKLVDVKGEDLKYMLEYIYTGTIKDLDNVDFANVLILADMYNLKGLFTLSQIALEKQLTPSNVMYTLIIADMYDAEYLKNSTMKYLKKNASTLDKNAFSEIIMLL